MIRSFKKASWRPGGHAKDTIRTGFWFAARVVLQMAYLALIGRNFGATGLGIFAGVMAIGGFFAPLASAGLGVVMIRKASQGPSDVVALRNRALAFTLPAGLLLFFLSVVGARLLFPANLPLTFLVQILLSEVLVAALFSHCNARNQATGHPHRSQLWIALLWLFRLVLLALVLTYVNDLGIVAAATLHLLSGVAILLLALPLQGMHLRSHSWAFPAMLDLREGMGYAASGIATVAFSDLNQSLVLSTLHAHDAGIFSAAYKMIIASTLPTSALSIASVKRLFETSLNRTDQSISKLRVFAAAGLALGVLSSVAVWLLAALLPILLGSDFSPSAQLAKSLSLIPIFIAGRTVAVALMTSHGMQSKRLWVECLIIPISLTTNYILASTFGLHGMIYGIFAIEIGTALTMGIMVIGLLKPQRPGHMEA